MNKLDFLAPALSVKNYDEDNDPKKYLARTDFKDYIEDEEYENKLDEAKNNLEKFLIYKFDGKYDCDKIFGQMFGYENTDTMNSFWTIFKHYIKIAKSDDFELENGEIKKEYIEEYKKMYDFELSNQQLWIIHILKFLNEKDIAIDENLDIFSSQTHCIGNFLNVPAGFNTNRYTNTLDYFDLTLLCIYKWYQTKSDFWLDILLNNNQQAIKNTKEWLEVYENLETSQEYAAWQKFIILNDLTFYIDDNFEPIEFFPNHFENFEKLITDKQKLLNYNEKEKLLNPQNINDLINAVDKVCKVIFLRGYEIIVECIEELEEQDDDLNYEKNNTYDKLIVTNKTDVDFPIEASVLNWNIFYDIACSENGICINDELFFDIELLNNDLYNTLMNFKCKVSFFRITPTYVNQKILDWKI